MTTVVFMRHAETDYNRDNRWMGIADFPLNNTGRNQAFNVAEQLKFSNFEAIYCSPLMRASETAQIIKNKLQNPVDIIYSECLKERDFGSFEGLKKNPIRRRLLDRSSSVESVYSVESRVDEFCKKLSKVKNGNYLLISHSSFYRVFIKKLNCGLDNPVKELGNTQYVSLCLNE